MNKQTKTEASYRYRKQIGGCQRGLEVEVAKKKSVEKTCYLNSKKRNLCHNTMEKNTYVFPEGLKI